MTLRNVRQCMVGSCALTLLAGCSSATTATPTSSGSGASITVSSTLDGLSTLPYRIHWEVTPGVPVGDVAEVDFLIDDQLAWVEYKAPYFYADDGNWLVTSFLTLGQHAFTVRVITTSGKTATRTVHAAVTARPPPPPAGLAGVWTRTVTAADLLKETSGLPTPVGPYRLTIKAAGWDQRDPDGAGALFDVMYTASETVEMRPTIQTPPWSSHGGFCANTDPIFDWTVALGDAGSTLILHPAGQDPCGDRVAVLEGTWTRVAP
jgi:hypothetical protein